MSVKKITQISIPGFEDYAIYSFDYTPGFSDAAGTIKCEFVNESGVYDPVDLSHNYEEVYIWDSDGGKESIGQYTTISHTTKEDRRSKTLSVNFTDRSVELDRQFVALRGEFGYDPEAYSRLTTAEKSRVNQSMAEEPRVLWLGESETPCKENIIGAVNETDPCDPCEDKLDYTDYRKLACDLYYLENKRKYVYSFQDLTTGLADKTGLNFDSAGLETQPSEGHKFDYSGSAREVLGNICSELGLTFYYNGKLNRIVFIDATNGIEINTRDLESESNKCKLLSISKGESREDKTDVWGVASFTKEGEEAKYACGANTCKKISLNPFSLTDMLTKPAHFHVDGGPAYDNFKRLEFYSIINFRLGKNFRDLFLMIQEYKLNTAIAFEGLKDTKLYKLNGMEVKRVFSREASDTVDREIYNLLLSVNSSKKKSGISKLRKNKTYFFLAKIDSLYEDRISGLEETIASNFIGKYWIRYYKEHWAGMSYSTLQPDGTVTYYDYGQTINLPFADMVFEAYKTLNVSPLLERDGGIAEPGESDGWTATDTFFLMERPTNYEPSELQEPDQIKINALVEKYLYKELAVPAGLSKKLEALGYDENSHRVFSVEREFGDEELDLIIADDVDHPVDKDNVNLPVTACRKKTSYGLKDGKCRSYLLKLGDFTTTIYGPAQGYVKDPGAPEEGYAGYNILVEKNTDDSSYKIPKVELFRYGDDFQDNSLKISSNLYSATKNDLQYLAKGESICDADQGKILNLLGGVIDDLDYSTGLGIEYSYTVEGLPSNFFSAEDGLTSMSISIGEAGATTSLSFSNTPKIPLGVDKLLKKLKYEALEKTWPIGVTNTSAPEEDFPEYPIPQ